MDFEAKSEPWSIYRLPDGREMRCRHVLTDVMQTGVDGDGNPLWNLNFSPIVHIEPSPEHVARIIEQSRKAQEAPQADVVHIPPKGTALQ